VRGRSFDVIYLRTVSWTQSKTVTGSLTIQIPKGHRAHLIRSAKLNEVTGSFLLARQGRHELRDPARGLQVGGSLGKRHHHYERGADREVRDLVT
jgi:hypothetical protein